MAKAKQRVATRKKSSKRGKANAKPGRKKAAKRTTPKKAKSKVRRTGRGALKPTAKKKWPTCQRHFESDPGLSRSAL